MKHNYDETQLTEAYKAALKEGSCGDTAADYMSAFLDALPDQPGDDALREQAGLYKDLLDHPFFKDWSISGTSIRSFMMDKLDSAMTPQDDWQECAFEDIQKGDRVKKVTTKEGTTETLEGTASQPLGKYTKSWANDQNRFMFDNHEFCDQLVRYYRIPAPVVAPDPAEHPVVIDGSGTSWFWSGTGDEYHSPERPGEYKDRFTNWTPGEVVPKVVETND